MGNFFESNFYKWLNPELKSNYDSIRANISSIYSEMENLVQDSFFKGFTFSTKLADWLWWVTNVLIKFVWFLMNHEYIFEIILILLILWIITKISKNILPPIVYLYSMIRVQGPRRRNFD